MQIYFELGRYYARCLSTAASTVFQVLDKPYALQKGMIIEVGDYNYWRVAEIKPQPLFDSKDVFVLKKDMKTTYQSPFKDSGGNDSGEDSTEEKTVERGKKKSVEKFTKA